MKAVYRAVVIRGDLISRRFLNATGFWRNTRADAPMLANVLLAKVFGSDT